MPVARCDSIGTQKHMNNTYVVMRHGQSLANVAGIILSNREEGKKNGYTLSPEGEEQVRRSVSHSKENGVLDKNVVIISSPFSRCVRTAEIAKEVLGVDRDIIIDERLRERWFGDWEKMSDGNYGEVWADDARDPSHTIANVESVRAVQERALALLGDLESRFGGKTILLVSHGDVLQFLQTGLQERLPAPRRDIPPLKTAEVRKIEI